MTSGAKIAFARHYLEMVLVMFAGMLVLGGPMLLGLAALGISSSELQESAPALYLTGMGLSMTVPMVWWMQRRGHSWPASRAMAAAMIAPTVAAIALLGSGAVTDFHALMMIEHIAMGPAMLIAMLPFRTEFTHSHAAVTA